MLDQLGEPIDTTRYLVLARRAVEEAAAIKIDDLPLETFDAHTRFALFWVRLYGRGLAPKSEARWQAMVSDIALPEINDILRDGDGGKGVRLAFGREASASIDETSSVVDVALTMARAWPEGLNAVAEILAASGRDSEDPHLWAAIGFLSARLPEADPDVQAWNGIVRGRRSVASATLGVVREHTTESREAEAVGRPDATLRTRRRRQRTMSAAVTPWWDAMRLRREIVAGSGVIDDVQMSLFNAVYGAAGERPPYSDATYYGDITHPSPNLVEFIARVAVRLGGGRATRQLPRSGGSIRRWAAASRTP